MPAYSPTANLILTQNAANPRLAAGKDRSSEELSPKNLAEAKSRELLAKPRKPPGDIPDVVEAMDVQVALVVPAIERGEAPSAIGILPMSTIGVGVGEGRIGLVDGGDGIRVGGLETQESVLILEIGVALMAIEFEEDNFNFLALAPRHRVHHLAVSVLLATRGGEHLLGCAGAVHLHPPDDQTADCFDAPAKNRELLTDEFGLAEDRLHGFGVEFSGVFLCQNSVVGNGLVDLTGRHCLRLFGWGHGFCHGVIVLS